MSKSARLTALTMSIVALSTMATVSIAQDAKKKKAEKTTGIVEVNLGKDEKFRLIIRDENDKYLATSAAFATKEDALEGLKKLKEVLENPKMTSKKADPKEKDKKKGKDKDKDME